MSKALSRYARGHFVALARQRPGRVGLRELAQSASSPVLRTQLCVRLVLRPLRGLSKHAFARKMIERFAAVGPCL